MNIIENENKSISVIDDYMKNNNSNESIKIYIVSHSEKDIIKIRNDDLYIPLFVGCYERDNLGFCSDDTGENISYKNRSYCELTGLYWIWKNSKADIVGLVHYRRYFSKNKYSTKYLERKDIEKYLKDADLIVPTADKSLLKNVYDDYSFWNYSKDMDLCREIIKEMTPEYINSFDKVMEGNSLYYYNMFISKKIVIDGYCAWIFPILEELEKRIDLSDYNNYQKRVYGFLTERLFNVWIIHNNYKVSEVDLRTLGKLVNIKMFIKKRDIARKLYINIYLPIKKRLNKTGD